MKKKQQGATLIVVLMLLVALTVIGTLAIRQSLVSLNIATNGQAQQLLMQNSDAATFSVEDSRNLVRSMARDGMFGFIKDPINRDKELVFCYRGSRSQFFTLSQASLIYNQDGTIRNNTMGTAGYCRAGSSSTQNFFTSNRRAVLTQVSVSFLNTAGSTPFESNIRGTDEVISKIQKTERVIVNTISLMPTLSTASDDEIDNCLMNRLSNTDVDAQSITVCLRNLNVPFTTHVTEYTLGQAFL